MILFGVLFFLAVALLLYALFGGADFGAGILEIFLGKKNRLEQQEVISRAIAPVWEANHIWLIIVVVILFMGFPKVYTTMSIFLYIPLMALLVGIVGRGCAFTFRHYDTLSNDYFKLYSRVFAFTSVWSAFFLGDLAGALILGKINPLSVSYYELYVNPWLNVFCVSMGLFTICLFALLAAVYLVGEAKTPLLRKLFLKKAKIFNVLLVVAGALVFITAEINGLPLLQNFFRNGISITCFVLATVLLIPFWLLLHQIKKTLMVRICAVAIVSLVFIGWYAVQYPVMLQFVTETHIENLDFFNSSAPQATLAALLSALIVGVLIIFPALGYLLKIFKWETLEK